MTEARLIIDEASPDEVPAYAGTRNMAIDETLLRSAAEQGVTSLRFYCWQQPTLSLGYFQQHQHRTSHTASRNCAWLRRASGGGAIMHHHELTYCLATPAKARFGDSEAYYLAFHETLVELLHAAGVAAGLQPGDRGLTDEAFLCFQRRASGDVILGGAKIAGSAQRRWKNALIQHGSVLLAKSTYAPELPGLKELSQFEMTASNLASGWRELLTSRLKVGFRAAPMTDKEKETADTLEAEKFSESWWKERR